ncbi:MAG: hypothetical protein KJP00_14190 [Bacteroidia bacterium]|nr:hypothetical protein [Bacteroidia bacterium]
MTWILPFLSILLLTPNNLPDADHSIYITVIEIALPVTKQEKGTLLIKAFSDDLQNALYQLDSGIGITSEPCSHSELLMDYTRDHLQLAVGQETILLESKSCELIGDTHWLRFDFEWMTTKDILTIQTDWFTELFPTQTNIVKVSNNGKTFYDRLSIEKQSSEIELK